MPNVTPNPVSLDDELGKLNQYKFHPNGILQVGLNRLKDMLGGKVEQLEPSNPFTYLLETTSLNTAFAIQEFALLSRKLYPRLANTDEDLYLHMSDYDYVGRFSEPSYAPVQFNILLNDFRTRAYLDPITKDRTLKLPRHLKITIGSLVYLMSSAVIIRQTASGVLDVRFEDQDPNAIFQQSTSYINFTTYSLANGEDYLAFYLTLPEVDVEVNDIALDATTINKSYLTFKQDRKFYHFRALYFKDNKWNEMLVTHTNEVYDINTPTCIIKVLPSDSTVQYHIPNIYINSGKMSDNVRVLIYTTSGQVTVNFNDFKTSDYGIEYADTFPETELDKYTNTPEPITKIVFIRNATSTGKDAMTFDELKQVVIDNSIGDRKLPITSKQLEFYSNQLNLRIIKDVDVVTNRIYKLETEIPQPVTRYPVTKFNMDIMEYLGSVEQLRQGNGVRAYGTDMTVIQEGTIFKLDNGILTILSPQQAAQLTALSGPALVNEVNNNTYLHTYFHYVLDTSNNRCSLKAYDLSAPTVSEVNFKTHNPTTRMSANSAGGQLNKAQNGYTLDLLTNFKRLVETISERNIRPYLIHTDVSGSKFFLESYLWSVADGQPVYRFLIDTNYFINSDNEITVTNFKDSNGATTSVTLNLNQTVEILYVSNTVPPLFKSTDMDNIISSSYLYGGTCAVSLEETTLSFGKHLERFYTASRTSVGVSDYQRYEQDVPLRYKKTVYSQNNEIVHEVGELVYDDQNNLVIEFQKGSVVLDDNNNPIPTSGLFLQRFLNFLFLDYRVTVSTAQNIKDYAKAIRSHLTTVCTVSALKVQEQLLDNTEAFVVVPKTIDYVQVKTASAQLSIKTAQKFAVTLLVNFDIFNNSAIRDNITYNIIKTIDNYLYQRNVLKRTELLNTLYTKLSEFIVSLSVDMFTDINQEYIELIDQNSRISIDKVLVAEASGYGLKENIDINFKMIDS